ncbi:proteasome subunit beta [Candidatus Woesearchaeota archaeon]|nr:proteasome subunit beta [Candidatus Woesearchaeota archaeon]
MENKEPMKTGTTTVGLICKDGVVLAADKRSTSGRMIMSKKFVKVHQIDDAMAVTIAGLVSDAQLFTKLIKAEIRLKKIRTNKALSVKEAANLLSGMVYSNIRTPSMVPGIVGFLIAGVDEAGSHLYNIGIDGSLTEIEEFDSDGSGSVFALGCLETIYKKGLTLEDGVKLAVKAVNAALQRDSASGDGVDVITIDSKGVKRVLTKEVKTNLVEE